MRGFTFEVSFILWNITIAFHLLVNMERITGWSSMRFQMADKDNHREHGISVRGRLSRSALFLQVIPCLSDDSFSCLNFQGLVIHFWWLLCYDYCCWGWTWQYEFKPWIWPFAFHITLIKLWIQLFSLQLWVNNRAD